MWPTALRWDSDVSEVFVSDVWAHGRLSVHLLASLSRATATLILLLRNNSSSNTESSASPTHTADNHQTGSVWTWVVVEERPEESERRLTQDDPRLSELQINVQICLQTDVHNGHVGSWLLSDPGQFHGAEPRPYKHRSDWLRTIVHYQSNWKVSAKISTFNLIGCNNIDNVDRQIYCRFIIVNIFFLFLCKHKCHVCVWIIWTFFIYFYFFKFTFKFNSLHNLRKYFDIFNPVILFTSLQLIHFVSWKLLNKVLNW